MRAQGLRGVGQSSWGPLLYGFSSESPAERAAILARLERRLGLPSSAAIWTRASRRGAILGG
jgi:predicted sugar kinase